LRAHVQSLNTWAESSWTVQERTSGEGMTYHRGDSHVRQKLATYLDNGFDTPSIQSSLLNPQ